MTVNQRNLLKIQQEKIFGEPKHLTIVKPCTIGEGILQFSMDDFNDYKTKFEEGSHKVCVFIPASGSGSRMFEFVRDYLYRPSEKSRLLV